MQIFDKVARVVQTWIKVTNAVPVLKVKAQVLEINYLLPSFGNYQSAAISQKQMILKLMMCNKTYRSNRVNTNSI